MAIDTPEKRRNVANIAGNEEQIDLAPSGDVGASDRKNEGEAYVGYDYSGSLVAPVAAFTFAVNPFTRLVQFSDASTNSPTEWEWSFSDPDSDEDVSAEQNPAHRFSAYGSFPVKLVAINGAGSNAVTHSVAVVDPGMPFSPITNHLHHARTLLAEQFRDRS